MRNKILSLGAIISCVSLLVYLAIVALNNIAEPYPLSPLEAQNLWLAQGSSLNTASNLPLGGLYPALIGLCTFPGMSPLLLGRSLSLLSFVLALLFFLYLLGKEKLPWAVKGLGLVLLGTVYSCSVQVVSLTADTLELALALAALILFFALQSQKNLVYDLFLGFFFAFPFFLTAELHSLTVGISCLLIGLLLGMRVGLTLLGFLLAVFGFLFFNGGLGFWPLYFSPWYGELFLNNLSLPLCSSGILVGLLLTTLCRSDLRDLRVNMAHPASMLFLVASLFCLWETGQSAYSGASWGLMLGALAWMIALTLGYLWHKSKSWSSDALLMLYFLFCGLVPHFANLSFERSAASQSLARSSKSVLSQVRGDLLSQDPSASLGGDQADFRSLWRDGKLLARTISRVEEKKYGGILLSARPRQLWPEALLSSIEKNYGQPQMITVFGEEGVLLRPDREDLDLSKLSAGQLKGAQGRGSSGSRISFLRFEDGGI